MLCEQALSLQFGFRVHFIYQNAAKKKKSFKLKYNKNTIYSRINKTVISNNNVTIRGRPLHI